MAGRPVRLQAGGVPGPEAPGRAAQPRRARRRRDDDGRRREQRPAGVVEVVGMVVVGEQHDVDRSHVGGRDRRAGGLARRRAQTEVVRPSRIVERRVGEDAPAGDLEQRRRPADVGQPDSGHALAGPSVGQRPVEGVVGDLLPAGPRRQQVRARVLLDLGDEAGRLVVLGVGALEARRHQVVVGAGDEQQRRAVGVLVVHPVVVLARVDVGEGAAPEDRPGGRDVVALVQPERLLLAEPVGEGVLPLLVA